MAYSKKEREEYNRRREHTSKELGFSKNDYNALRRVSHELSKHGEHEANTGESRRREVGKSFSKAEALRKKVYGKKAKSKLHFYHQTDPRGVALYASKEKMKNTNYNSKGKPIY